MEKDEQKKRPQETDYPTEQQVETMLQAWKEGNLLEAIKANRAARKNEKES